MENICVLKIFGWYFTWEPNLPQPQRNNIFTTSFVRVHILFFYVVYVAAALLLKDVE